MIRLSKKLICMCLIATMVMGGTATVMANSLQVMQGPIIKRNLDPVMPASLSKKKISLRRGKSKKVKVYYGKIQKVSSSKKSVVSVRKKGTKIVVRGKKKGKATIKVIVNDYYTKNKVLKLKVKVK